MLGKGVVEQRDTVTSDLTEAGTKTGEAQGVTPRAVVIGICTAVVVGFLASTLRFVQKGSVMTISFMPMGNLLLFLLLLLAFGVLVRGFGRRFVLSSSEWITIFSMGLVSCLGPNYGIAGYLLGSIVTPYYLATPENRWAEFLHPHLPGWLVPGNESGAINLFFEGLPRGASIPWEVWALPLFWWFLFIAALAFACFCVAVIFRRQWADHEKLVYPALKPILAMVSQTGVGQGVLPHFMRGRVFWAGFGFVSVVFWWNMISWFYPGVPKFPIMTDLVDYWDLLPKHYPPIFFHVSTVVFCFSYFASLDVLFSMWFFDLLYIVEAGPLNRVGLVSNSPHYGAGPYVTTSYKWQTAGAFLAWVLWWLWTARGHLREVFHKALRPDRSSLDDRRELISYRGAAIGLIVCCFYIAAWLWQMGIEARAVALLVPSMFIVYLGVAKVVADSGLIYLEPAAVAWNYSLFALGGARALNATTHVSNSLLKFSVNHPRSFAMPTLAHISRLGDSVTGNRRRLFWWVLAAFIVGMTVSTLYTIWLAYTLGAHNFRHKSLIFTLNNHQLSLNAITNPRSILAAEYWLFLAGAAAMVAMNLMRYRFSWWRLHPLGFALSGTIWSRLESGTFLVAWLVKLLILKIGGVSFYRRSRPFIMGMLIGYVLAVLAGMVVDGIWFPDQGHRVHHWY